MGTTAEKLTYLNTTKQKIKDAINNIGGNITSETTFRQYVAALESIYQSMPKVSGTGTSLSLSPTLKGLMQIDLKGNTSQVQLSGKNKLGLVGDSSNNVNGIVNNDGTITISGTSNITDGKVLFRTTNNIVAGTYTLTISKALSYVINLSLATGVSFRIPAGSKSITTTLTTDYGSDVPLFVALTNGTTYNDTFNIQLTSGSTADYDFEQYCGGVPSPNPSYPQDIHNVSGNNDIVVCGKNLFDKDNANVIDGYIQASTAKIISGSSGIDEIIYIPCKPNTTYTIQKIMNTPYNRNRFRIGTSSTIPANNTILDNFYRYDSDTQESGNPTEITYTTGENANYLVIYVWTLNGNYTFQQTIDSIQIEYGSEATTYEAYNGTTYPINLPSGMELSKIGTYQDYIYKENDKWYLHKETGKVVLNGTEADSDYGTGTTGSFTRFGYNPFQNTNLIKTQSDYVSNYFRYLGTIGGDTTEAGISNTAISNLNRLFIFLPTSLVSTISAFKTWLTTHNTIVYYILATPINTEITDTTLIEQLDAIYNAKSKNGTTNINQVNNDLGFILDVSCLKGA